MKIYRCPHCETPLKRSRFPQYAFECPECDKDFYEWEEIPDEILVTYCAINPNQS